MESAVATERTGLAKVYDPQKEQQDLGFGSVLSRQGRLRLLNRDGTFNVQRSRVGPWQRVASFHSLISMSWGRFALLITIAYLGVNLVFACLYLLCGPGALDGAAPMNSNFARAFVFSVETLFTIGYGNIIPVGLAANVLVTFEAIAGLLNVGLIAGIAYARFARPVAKMIFSEHAVIAPYRGITAFEFRIMNSRQNELIEVNARIILTRFEQVGGKWQRAYHNLQLERASVAFFPLSWTVVHPIDETSPLFGWDSDALLASEAEFLILLTATDETFAQVVHSRSSYAAHELVWNAKFASMFAEQATELHFDPDRLHEVERLEQSSAA